MIYLLLYLFLGYLVSIFFICYYRLCGQGEPQKYDALLALLGTLIWPAQIALFFYHERKKRKNKKQHGKN